MKNNSVDWKRKLTSRKFWMAIAGFVTGLITYINSPNNSPEAITGLIMQGASVVSYIIGEGLADGGVHEENHYHVGEEED